MLPSGCIQVYFHAPKTHSPSRKSAKFWLTPLPPLPPLAIPHERSSTKNSNFASPGRPSVDLLTKKTRLGSVVRIAGLNLTNHFEHILSTSDPADGILVNGTPGNSMHGVRRHHLDSIRGMNQHQGCGG